jgi:hypothetical protein
MMKIETVSVRQRSLMTTTTSLELERLLCGPLLNSMSSVFITHLSCKLNWQNRCDSLDVLVLTNSVNHQQNKRSFPHMVLDWEVVNPAKNVVFSTNKKHRLNE